MKRSILASLLLLVPAVLFAGSYIVPSDRELIESADAIVIGDVLASYSYYGEGGKIFTDTILRISESVRGVNPSEVRITEEGGVVGDRAVFVSTTPVYVPGQRVLAMLKQDGSRLTTHEHQLGQFLFVTDVLSRTYLVRGTAERPIHGWDAQGEAHRERLRDAGAFVDYARRLVGGEPKEEGSFSGLEPAWPLRPVVADSHFPGNNYLQQFGFSPSGGARWQAGGYSMMTSGTQSGADVVTTTQAGVAPWNDDSNSSISLTVSGSTTNFVYGSSNNENVVYFGQPNSGPLAGSTVGQATLFATSAQHTYLGESFYTSVECDVIIEDGLQVPGVLQAVVAHEIGHCLGFRHSNDPTPPTTTDALMNATVSGGGAVLRDWDREAANHIYGDGTLGSPSCTAPSITAHPQNQTITEGQSANLSVSATGTATLAYQWFVNGSPLSGGTVASISVSGLTAGSYSFHVTVTNSCGNVTSNTATVTVNTVSCTAPSITAHPQNQTITEGQSANLSVSATGTATLAYQWFVNGSPLSGGTVASISVSGLTAGSYSFHVTVTNSCGNVTSNTATVTVNTVSCTSPSVTSHPQSQNINSGESVTLFVSASGTSPFSYQWRRNGTAVSGATGTSFNTGVLTAGTYSFDVIVSNSCGSVSSNTATIGVTDSCVSPQVTSHPQSTTIQTGQSTSLSVGATGSSLQYQWYRGSSPSQVDPVFGATGATLNTGTLNSTTSFWVRVFNSCGSVNSNTATVTVQPACVPAQITVQPQSKSISRGQSTSLSVSASGTAPLSYQWFRGTAGNMSSPISGATSATLNTGSLQATTSFWVRVTNQCNSANSNTATVTVTGSARKRIVNRPG